MEAPTMDDPNDDSYWIPPQPTAIEKNSDETIVTNMCSNCVDDCGTRYFHERIMGNIKGPVSLEFWTLGDPRFNDPDNPLFAPHMDPNEDWRATLDIETFRDFYNYVRYKYGCLEEKCKECTRLKKKRDRILHVCKAGKSKKSKTKEQLDLIKDLKEVRSRINELEDEEIKDDYEERIHNIIKEKPRVQEALEEVKRKDKLEKLHAEQLNAELEKEKEKEMASKNHKRVKSPAKKSKQEQKQTSSNDTKILLTETVLVIPETDMTNKFDKRSEDKIDSSEGSSVEKIIKTVVDVKSTVDEKGDNLPHKQAVEGIVDKTSPGKKSEKDISTETSDNRKESCALKELPDCDFICIAISETIKKKVIREDGKTTTEEKETAVDVIEQSDKENKNGNESIGSEEKATQKSEKEDSNMADVVETHTHSDTCPCEDIKLRYLSEQDITPSKNIVSGFKVIKIEDHDNGLFEVNLSAACLKTDEEEESYNKEMKEKLESQELNNFILSANILRETILGLPKRLEWWEGRGFAIAIVNYEEEEKELTKHWTDFTLKINGYDEVTIKQMLIKLLIYVSKRKRRPCPGWKMEVDDIVACILPEETKDIEDLTIGLSRGFRFEDRLTEFEKETLLKHHPNLNLDLVLCGMEKGSAVKTLEKKGGKEKLRKIIDAVSEKEIFSRDLPVVDVEKLRKKLNNKAEITKADILWEQMIRKPENFEFFVFMTREFVLNENEWWKNGMKSFDIRLYNETKNPILKICPICKVVGMECSCDKPMIAAPKIVEFVGRTDFEKVNVLGEGNEPKIPNMKYTETKLGSNTNEKPSGKKSKASKLAKKKEKRIELSEIPTKFIDAGVDVSKTTITVPARNDEPIMGLVPIPLHDKLERLAPVPGVQSSLNFTFQNGKKEQTITVTLGAYMPEERINALQEKKELAKILEEEDKRRAAKAIGSTEKRDKKDKDRKRDKTKSKSPQKSISKSGDFGRDETLTMKEKLTQTTTRFLKEILKDDEEVNHVTRSLHQNFGMSNKKSERKKKEKEIAAAAKNQDEEPPHCCACCNCHPELTEAELNEFHSTFSEAELLEFHPGYKKEQAEKETCRKDTEHLNGLKETDSKVEEKAISGKEDQEVTDSKSSAQETVDEKTVFEMKNDEEQDADTHPETEGSTVDKIPDDDENKVNLEKEDKGKDDSSEEKDGLKFGNLKACGNCEKIEPSRRTFKKCLKCKEEGVLEVRYYCSRECQVDDWKKKHKMEHIDGLLG